MHKVLFVVSVFISALLILSGCSGSKSKTEEISESVMIDKISKTTGINRSQAQVGLSALMILSEEKLSQEEFTKLTNDFPGGKNLVDLSANLGFTPGSVKTPADVIQILVNLGVNPVDAGKFLASVLSLSKNLEGGVYELLSKVYES